MPATELNVKSVRAKFSALNSIHNGHPAAFFDNPGGTQVPDSVIHAVSNYYLTSNANIGGYFVTSERTTEVMRAARQAVGDLLNAHPNQIVFGPNMTTLTFHLARSIGDSIVNSKGRHGHRDEIVVTNLDHDANVTPWTDLQAQGAVIRAVDIHPEDCTLDMRSFERALSDRTKLVAITHASNAVGTITDVARLVKMAKRAGALTFVDAVQYAPHGLIDVQALGCDWLVCSAYKFFGPHVGILYGLPEALDLFTPHKVRPAKNEKPWRWETGTPNFEGLSGVTAAIEYLAGVGGERSSDRRADLTRSMNAITRYEQTLSARLIMGFATIPGLRVHGITERARTAERLPTFAFTWDRMTPAETARRLAEHGIACWSGNYYALPIMERLGLESSGGAVRIGAVHYNTIEEIDRLIETLRRIAD